MKLAVVGSREYDDAEFVIEILGDYLNEFGGDLEIVSGGARGVDRIAERWAEQVGVPCVVYLPNWDAYGRGAGIVRNRDIVDYCDSLIAFWDGVSKGTLNSIKLAREAGKLEQVYV